MRFLEDVRDAAQRVSGPRLTRVDTLRRLPCVATRGHRVLGLDVGSRTIGVAVTDELGACAHALRTLQRRGTRGDVAHIAELADQYETRRLVVGIPYDLEGNEGKRAERVRVFIAALTEAGFTVETEDERFSTVEAERSLLEADLSRARRKQVIDALAAQVILTAWLRRQPGGPEPARGDEG
jgi:putative holliday junction resolvase